MATQPLYNHNPALMTLVIGGHTVQGYGQSMIQVTRNADAASYQAGAQGAGVRSVSMNRSANITFSLMYGSPTNTFLSQLADGDFNGGQSVVPVMFKDNNNNDTFCHSESAWVLKVADTDIQAEATERTWTLVAHNLQYIAGGEKIAAA